MTANVIVLSLLSLTARKKGRDQNEKEQTA
jgi:hypothetical protein